MEKLHRKKEYLGEIDVLKAIGIILVVIGHSFPDASAASGISSMFGKMIYNIIYSFHMPAFVFASGIVSYNFYQTIYEKQFAIRKRAIRLLIPYFVWGIVYIPFRIILNGFASEAFRINQIWRIFIGDNPYSGLWFLYTLFLVSLLHILIIDNDKRLILLFGISIIGIVINEVIAIVEPIKWIIAYSFYYFGGLVFKKNYSFLKKIFEKKIVRIMLVFLFGSMFVIKMKLQSKGLYFFNILPAVCGVLMLYSFSCLLKENKILRKMGTYSMDIYILSGPILVALRIILYRILGLNYMFYTITAIVLSCVLSVWLSACIIRKNKYLSLFLLGKR